MEPGLFAMTEHSYIRSVHRQLKKLAPHVYVWKINDNYQGGVADAYYSSKQDLWIEYKYLKALPKKPTTPIRIDLSQLQQDWLYARHHEGRSVCVIIGSPSGSLVLPGLGWRSSITAAEFIKSCVDIRGVVAYILGDIDGGD